MKRTLLSALFLLVISFDALVAQDSQLQLRPIAEYVPTMMENDSDARHVFRRCGGLFGLIALQMQERAEAGNDDALAVGLRYLEWVEGFILALSTLDPLFEKRKDEVMERSRDAIRGVAEILVERMNQNLLVSGELWGQDTLILGDMEICGALAKNLFGEG